MKRGIKYVGIDGCKAGWFYVCLDDNQSYDFGILKSITDLSRISNSEDVVLIDIPIGLREKDQQERECDKATRKLLKRKGSSVFPAPSRLSLSATSYQEASNLNFKHTGRKLSKQSYAVANKIKETDTFVQNKNIKLNLREYHPELCFLSLNASVPLESSKKDKAGHNERIKILEKYLSRATEIIEKAKMRYLRKQVAIDDIIDAIAGALTASFKNNLKTAPDIPEIDNKGIIMEIVYPAVNFEKAN